MSQEDLIMTIDSLCDEMKAINRKLDVLTADSVRSPLNQLLIAIADLQSAVENLRE